MAAGFGDGNHGGASILARIRRPWQGVRERKSATPRAPASHEGRSASAPPTANGGGPNSRIIA